MNTENNNSAKNDSQNDSYPSYKIFALYKFVFIEEPDNLKKEIETLGKKYNVKGNLILSKEGVNGTVAGMRIDSDIDHEYAVDLFLKELQVLKRGLLSADGMEIKASYTDEEPFHHLRLSLKKVSLNIKYSIVRFALNILFKY